MISASKGSSNLLRIKIRGIEKIVLLKTAINKKLSVAKNEVNIQKTVNAVCKARGYHCYVHIENKILKNFVFWLGHVGDIPPKNWWVTNDIKI